MDWSNCGFLCYYCLSFFRYEPSGQKRILLRKLGNTPSFFSFVEGKEALFVVSPEKPGTSHLPEAIHLLDTNGVHPCLTYESGRGSSRFLCYNVVHVPDKGEFLLIGGYLYYC